LKGGHLEAPIRKHFRFPKKCTEEVQGQPPEEEVNKVKKKLVKSGFHDMDNAVLRSIYDNTLTLFCRGHADSLSLLVEKQLAHMKELGDLLGRAIEEEEARAKRIAQTKEDVTEVANREGPGIPKATMEELLKESREKFLGSVREDLEVMHGQHKTLKLRGEIEKDIEGIIPVVLSALPAALDDLQQKLLPLIRDAVTGHCKQALEDMKVLYERVLAIHRRQKQEEPLIFQLEDMKDAEEDTLSLIPGFLPTKEDVVKDAVEELRLSSTYSCINEHTETVEVPKTVVVPHGDVKKIFGSSILNQAAKIKELRMFYKEEVIMEKRDVTKAVIAWDTMTAAIERVVSREWTDFYRRVIGMAELWIERIRGYLRHFGSDNSIKLMQLLSESEAINTLTLQTSLLAVQEALRFGATAQSLLTKLKLFLASFSTYGHGL